MSRTRQPTFKSDGIDPREAIEKAKPKSKPSNAEEAKIREISKATGFNSRLAFEAVTEPKTQPTFDARSLRKSSRTAQLNIAIQPETKDRFWQFAVQNLFTTGEDALLKLLERAGV